MEFTSMSGNKTPKKKAPTNIYIAQTRPLRKKSRPKKVEDIEVTHEEIIPKRRVVTKRKSVVFTKDIYYMIQAYPQDVKDILKSNTIVEVKAQQADTLFIFDDKSSMRVKEDSIGKRKILRVVIKQGKKELLNTVLNR